MMQAASGSGGALSFCLLAGRLWRVGESCQEAQWGQEPLAEAHIPGPLLPVFEAQLEGIGLIVLEKDLHLTGQVAVVDLHVDLVVADRAEAVEVGGADGCP